MLGRLGTQESEARWGLTPVVMKSAVATTNGRRASGTDLGLTTRSLSARSFLGTNRRHGREAQQLSGATNTGCTWERLTLTVDSGASDTVIPAHLLQWCAMLHTAKVGTEYEVANGDVVHNFENARTSCALEISPKMSWTFNSRWWRMFTNRFLR